MRGQGHGDLPQADPQALSPGEPWLAAAAARRPQRLALRAPEGDLTYAQLASRAGGAAAAMAARDVGPGDRVALALPPGAGLVIALHACLRLGAVAMPVDVRLGQRERAAQTAGAALVVDRPLEHDAQASAPTAAVGPDDPAVVIHTSGTTGAARPVELTRANWEAAARAAAQRLGVGEDERWLCALPLSHVGGLSIVVRSAIQATTAIVLPRFDAEAVARALAQDVTIVSLVPTMLARVLDAGAVPGPRLRCVLVGGGPLSPALAERGQAAGFPLAHTYGLTEACSQVTTSAIGQPQTAGRPLDGTAVEIAPDGQILVAGPTVAPAARAADGWLHTGDLGRLDGAGRLVVTGRRSEIIVTGGENVAAAEVEAVLESHPAVAEAAVHARPDAEWGEALVATVVLRPGWPTAPEQLRRHCAAALAPFKVPKTIELADALPRTASGKLRRDAL